MFTPTSPAREESDEEEATDSAQGVAQNSQFTLCGDSQWPEEVGQSELEGTQDTQPPTSQSVTVVSTKRRAGRALGADKWFSRAKITTCETKTCPVCKVVEKVR